MNQNTLFAVLIALTFAVVMLAINVHSLLNTRPTYAQVEALLEKESKIYEMLNAKMDCEKLVPRTQECILYYEYLAVEK